jgi:hypothetical protein
MSSGSTGRHTGRGPKQPTLPRQGDHDEPAQDRHARGLARRPQRAAGEGKEPDQAARRAQRRTPEPAHGRDHQGLPVRRPGRHGAADRHLRRPPPAHHLPLHVPPGVGGRLPQLLRRHRRAVTGLHGAPPCAGHQLRDGVPGTAGQAAALEGQEGMGRALVLVLRVRLQLRLRRHDRCLPRLRPVQLPLTRRVRGRRPGEHEDGRPALRHARPELLPAGRRPHIPHLLPVRPRPGVDRRLLLLPRPHRPRTARGVGGTRRPQRVRQVGNPGLHVVIGSLTGSEPGTE